MDPLEKLFAFAEGNETRKGAYVLNSVSSFISFIESRPEFQNAEKIILSNVKGQLDRVGSRIASLISINSQDNELHSYDVAIAIYLYLVQKTAPSETKRFIKAVEGERAKNFWWTQRLAGELKDSPIRESTESKQINLGPTASDFSVVPPLSNKAISDKTDATRLEYS